MLRGLCLAGVFLRVQTVLTAFALLAASGYAIYTQFPELVQPIVASSGESLPYIEIAVRARVVIELALPFLSGFFLLALEWASTCNEAAARASLGLAFGACGRFCLFMLLMLVSIPAVTVLPFKSLEFIVLGGALCLLPINALLQGWFLSCLPEYARTTVAELNMPNGTMDSSQFPQIYQRDEGEHLHLGVLLPGFDSRDSCTMSANCSQIQLVGDIAQLDAPFSTSVDSNNSTAGPFGPFTRDVMLAHPVDVTTPVESRYERGILEFRFQKGYPLP